MSRPAAKRILLPALLLLFGTGAGLAVAEVAVRVLDPHARDHALPGGFFAMDTVIGWRQRPSHVVTHRTRYFDATYATNALGYRDPNWPAAPASGRTRVLVFGDSQVFGWGVRQGRRFTDLLEARHPELEVWNLGVMGYGFDQELLEYERRGEEWRADVVVLFATTYTLERAKSGYIYRKHKPKFVLRGPDSLELLPPAARGTALTQLAYRLLSPLYLPYFLERRVGALLGRPKSGPPAPIPSPAADSTRPPAVDPLTEALFRRAARLAGSRSQRLVLLTNFEGDRLEQARSIGRKHGFSVAPVELPGSYPDWVFGPGDRHWTERSHSRIADILWEHVKRE